MTLQWKTQTHKRCYRCKILLKLPWKNLSDWYHQDKLSRAEAVKLTRVGHELKRATEFPVSGRRASPHMEHVRGEWGEALDVGVPGWGFYDPVAPFILVLGKTESHSERLHQWFRRCYRLFLLNVFPAGTKGPGKPSPSRSTWPHTPVWLHWLCLVAATPVRWCASWYPSPGWKTLERELREMIKEREKKRRKMFSLLLSRRSSCCFQPWRHRVCFKLLF